MKLTFVLPGFRARPVGGFLVVYRYASELSRRGHEVTIVHPRRLDPANKPFDRLKAVTWHYRKRLRYSGGRPPWFELDQGVDVILAPDLRETPIPNGDAIFATACNTAPAVWSYSAEKGRKLYLVQHYEDWVCGKAGVEATWRLPMHKVVSSRWLYEIGLGLDESERLTHIPYGVELDTFRVTRPINDRSPLRVGMLAHLRPFKGMAYGIEALEAIRRSSPDVEAFAFGTGRRPGALPEWVRYVENPTRRALADLYNSLAIFLHTSVTEGWGLTGAEAVACGCALVAADSGGVRDYAVDGETALLVPPRSPDALAARALELIENDGLRLRLASRGSDAIQSLTWDRATETLETVIRQVCRAGVPASAPPALDAI